jgi:hypothetical protein
LAERSLRIQRRIEADAQEQTDVQVKARLLRLANAQAELETLRSRAAQEYARAASAALTAAGIQRVATIVQMVAIIATAGRQAENARVNEEQAWQKYEQRNLDVYTNERQITIEYERVKMQFSIPPEYFRGKREAPNDIIP